jgi:hypothetical protein
MTPTLALFVKIFPRVFSEFWTAQSGKGALKDFRPLQYLHQLSQGNNNIVVRHLSQVCMIKANSLKTPCFSHQILVLLPSLNHSEEFHFMRLCCHNVAGAEWVFVYSYISGWASSFWLFFCCLKIPFLSFKWRDHTSIIIWLLASMWQIAHLNFESLTK